MSSLRGRIAGGVTAAFLYQLFSLGLAAISLLVLSRIVPKEDFGAFAAASLWLAGFGNLAGVQVVRYALLDKSTEAVDWNLYAGLGVAAQVLTTVVCLTVASVCWWLPTFRFLAPLLAVASISVFCDAFVQLNLAMAERDLEYRRIQYLTGAAETLRLVVSLGFAFAGLGLWGLLLGNTVVLCLPHLVDLFVVRRWRPDVGRWLRIRWTEAAPAVRFAGQFALGNAGNAGRLFAESILTPLAFTTAQMGLWSRGQALFQQTGGRLLQGLNQAASPALLRSARGSENFAAHAAVYHRVLGGMAAGCTAFLAAMGPVVVAVLYGPKWVEVNPLLAPAALAAAAGWYASICSGTLIAAGRQRENVLLLGCMTVAAIPGLIALAWHAPLVVYAWIQSAGLLAAAAASAALCRPVIGLRRLAANLAPAAVAAVVAGIACALLDFALIGQSKYLRLGISILAFVAVHFALLRCCFPRWFAESLDLLPMGAKLRRLLRV